MLFGTEAIIVHTVDQPDWFFSVVPLNLVQFMYKKKVLVLKDGSSHFLSIDITLKYAPDISS